MSEQWSISYRPKTFDSVVGQPQAVALAKAVVKNPKNVVLLHGPSGSGKTTLAKIIVNETNGPGCEMDFKEVNGVSNGSKDEMRALIQESRMKPSKGKRRFILIDEVHAIRNDSASVLLTPLESTNTSTTFLLCTNEPNKILPTLLNRSYKIGLVQPKIEDTANLLEIISNTEGVLKPTDKYAKIFTKISETANGTPRESIQLLQALVDLLPKKYDYKQVNSILFEAIKANPEIESNKAAVKTLIGIYKNNPAMVIKAINDTTDYIQFIQKLIWFNSYLLEHLSGIQSWSNVDREALLNNVGDIAKINKVVLVHETLVDIKAAIGTFLVDGKDLLLGKLVKHAIRKEKA